jgi:hypothetical protein
VLTNIRKKMRIFAENRLDDYFTTIASSIRGKVESENENYILNVSEDAYIEFLVSEFKIDNLEIHFDNKYVTTSDRMIPGEHFPKSFDVYVGKKYKKTAIEYHIPYTGNTYLLKCIPKSRISWSANVNVIENEIQFDIINFRNNAEEIEREAENILRPISQQVNNVKSEVEVFNSKLEGLVRQSFNARKEVILKKNDFLSKLTVPIKKNLNVPETFSIPTPKTPTRIEVKRPEVLENNYKPEPTLDEVNYNSILEIIQNVGKQFERMPSTYKDKEEEELRDHILLYLEPNFQGSATGETFNKKGKTDILLRYEGENVFISECKFWKGEKSFLKTIDQLLGYLTWRDSKSSITLFVQNKDFSKALGSMKAIIQTHDCFVKYVNIKNETWFNYLFHLPDDQNRNLKLAVQLFHIPK